MSRLPLSRHQLMEFSGFTLAWIFGVIQFLTSGFTLFDSPSQLEYTILLVSGPLLLLGLFLSYKIIVNVLDKPISGQR